MECSDIHNFSKILFILISTTFINTIPDLDQLLEYYSTRCPEKIYICIYRYRYIYIYAAIIHQVIPFKLIRQKSWYNKNQ